MAALQCTCYGKGQACNKGERVGGGDWDYYVGEGMASRVVDYLVGEPEAGEDREDAGLRVLRAKLVESASSCDPAMITWEQEMIARSLLMGKAIVREAVLSLLDSLGWRPREIVDVEGIDYVYSHGRLVPLLPAGELVPLSQRGWPTSAEQPGDW